jgi:hypothetical protein
MVGLTQWGEPPGSRADALVGPAAADERLRPPIPEIPHA